jgi:hypothetical protein
MTTFGFQGILGINLGEIVMGVSAMDDHTLCTHQCAFAISVNVNHSK